MTRLAFTVLGEPVSRQRPRVTRFSTYTPDETVNWYSRIVDGWRVTGSVRLEGIIGLEVRAFFVHGRSHLNTKGGLNATGRRAVPGGARDVDSLTVSPVMDALNRLAWADDRLICEAHGLKGWCAQGEPARLEVHAWEIDVHAWEIDVRSELDPTAARRP